MHTYLYRNSGLDSAMNVAFVCYLFTQNSFDWY